MVMEDDLWPFQQNAPLHSPNLSHTSKLLPPSAQQSSLPSCMNPSLFCTNAPNDANGSIQKRFIIFDQCGNQVRMFYSPIVPSPRVPFVAPVGPACSPHLHDEKQATIVEKIAPTKGVIQDTSGDNHVIGEGSEMHEDTEEINALLYSDDDNDDDDDDDDYDDDEVTSTYRSPFAIEENHGKFEKEGEITERVGSSGGPIKRQRLIDGEYKKLLSKLDSSCKYESNAESSYLNDGIELKKSTGSILGVKRSRKDKINETLRILESIIPSSRSKDPLLVIDEAIDYLKSLKLKVKDLGLTHP